MRKVAEKRDAYREALLNKKAEVLSVPGIRFETMEALGRIAEDDQAQVSHDEFISLHVNRLVYDMLRDVNEALLRLERGEYGLCARCEAPIPQKRLRALPWARYCVACQEEIGVGRPEGEARDESFEPQRGA